jgi:ankyrin repeat protein
MDTCGHTALHLACSLRKVEVVRTLLQRGPPFVKDKEGRDPLEYSRQEQKKLHEICQILEAHQAQGSVCKDDAVRAIKEGAWTELESTTKKAICTKQFLPNFLDQPYEEGTLLYFACAQQQPECVRVLVDLGADPSVTNPSNGQTPLHIAAQKDLACVKQLLRSEVCFTAFTCVP